MHHGNDEPDITALVETLDHIALKPTDFSTGDIQTFAKMAADALRLEESIPNRSAVGHIGHSGALRVYSEDHDSNDD